jgi:hypothetical protein
MRRGREREREMRRRKGRCNDGMREMEVDGMGLKRRNTEARRGGWVGRAGGMDGLAQ